MRAAVLFFFSAAEGFFIPKVADFFISAAPCVGALLLQRLLLMQRDRRPALLALPRLGRWLRVKEPSPHMRGMPSFTGMRLCIALLRRRYYCARHQVPSTRRGASNAGVCLHSLPPRPPALPSRSLKPPISKKPAK